MKNKFISILLIFIIIGTIFSCGKKEESIEKNDTVVSVDTNNKNDVIKEIDNNITLENDNSINEDIDNNIEKNISNSKLEILFIDVGQGDSALITCDGHYLLIDGGPVYASSLLYSYLKKLNINYIDYIICTHPDADHVGGLPGALNYASLGIAYCPEYADTIEYNDFIKYVEANDSYVAQPKIGETFDLGSANVEIIASNIGHGNDASIVTKVTFGDTSFLFMGDAETEVEDYLINNNVDIKCDVLKVAHHGSRYATGYNFLYTAEPKYAVISVGSDNTYGHPTEEVLSKLRDADVKTYRTDMQGNIICISDGSNIIFKTEKNENADTYKEVGENSVSRTITRSKDPINESENYTYCINTSSKKFHYSNCSSVDDMKEHNKKYTNEDRDSLISQGYSPCKRCNP